MAQLSDEVLKELTDYIEVQGRAWAVEYINNRIAYLKSRGLSGDSALLQSMSAEVTSTLQNAAETYINIAFEKHGRYIDMKYLKAAAGGNAYIEALVQWMQDKNLDAKFRSKSLSKRKLKVVPVNILNQIAWGIVRSRQTRYKRRLAWYSKSRAGALNTLYNKVAANIPRIVGTEIKNAFAANSK
jgi:hypothetical protein